MSKSDTIEQRVYDRKEERAIGHFIEMADKQFEHERLRFGEGISYRGVIKELQREHGCYD